MNTEPGAIVEMDGKRFRVTERKVELTADERYRVTVVYEQISGLRPMTQDAHTEAVNAIGGPTTATPRGVRR
jgi:hypothetical protein